MQRQVGVLGMLFISMGIAGSFVAGVVLDTTRQYALFTKVRLLPSSFGL